MQKISALSTLQKIGTKFLNNIKLTLLIDLVALLFAGIEYAVFLLSDDFYFGLLQAQLFVFTAWMVLTCYKITKNWFSIEIIFIGTIVLFLLSRIFLNLFFPEIYPAYGEAQWLKDHTFANTTMLKVKFILLFALISLHIGFFTGYAIFRNNPDKEKIKYSKVFGSKLIYVFLAAGLIAYAYKVYFYYNVLSQYGYFAIYDGNHILPLWVRILDDFLYLAFFIILANKPSKKVAYSLSFAFILIYFTYALTGMRAEFMLLLLATLWLLAFLYDWNVKIKYVALLMLGIVFFSNITLALKSNVGAENTIFTSFASFFYSQGVSLLVIGYIVEFENMFISSVTDGIRYVASPFVSKFLFFTGQEAPRSAEEADFVHSISDKLEFFLNPESYLAGGGDRIILHNRTLQPRWNNTA